MEGRRYCSKCQIMQKIEKFEENYKTCNVCREKAKRYGQTHKQQIAEQKREYRAQNPEKVKEWRRNHLNKIKDEVVMCPVCNYEIKKYKQAQHQKSQTHQYYLQKLNYPDFEKDVPKPDKIREINGKEHYCCNTCRSSYLPPMWSRHFNKPPHLKPETA